MRKQRRAEWRNAPRSSGQQNAAFQVKPASAAAQVAHAPGYARVLERYLARLVELKEILSAGRASARVGPQPGMIPACTNGCSFLGQNRLGVEQEEIIARDSPFSDRSWYHKLGAAICAREECRVEKLYAGRRAHLPGSELEHYFKSLVGGTPEMYLR